MERLLTCMPPPSASVDNLHMQILKDPGGFTESYMC